MKGLGRATTFAVVLFSSLLFVPGAASAHGHCDISAQQPARAGAIVIGKATIDCGSNQHDKYKIDLCVQTFVNGGWQNSHCDTVDSGVGCDCTSWTGAVSDICARVEWRTKFREGWVYNNAGDLAHHFTTNVFSSVLDESHDGLC